MLVVFLLFRSREGVRVKGQRADRLWRRVQLRGMLLEMPSLIFPCWCMASAGGAQVIRACECQSFVLGV